MAQPGPKTMAEGSLEGSRSVERSTLSAVTEAGPEGCGGESASSSSKPAHSSEYFSARIQSLIEGGSEYETAAEAEIEASKAHWSELPDELRKLDSDEQHCLEEENLAFFRSLQLRFPPGRYERGFFSYGKVELGEKIAEGAQGAIYSVEGAPDAVLKVFKLEGGLSLEDLYKQWPPGMLKVIEGDTGAPSYIAPGVCAIYSGFMINGSFGFMMKRYWGDLRKMIDKRMIHNGNQASPFNERRGFKIIHNIASGMRALLETDIVHRDLKAANLLIRPQRRQSGNLLYGFEEEIFDPLCDSFRMAVADFESSVGVVGSRFWRAPELLIALKNRCFHPDLYTEKSDVYSFGMTCYEVLTGKIPLEEERPTNYDLVIGGTRPTLPSDTKRWFQSMLDRCWHHEPSERPTFDEIVTKCAHVNATWKIRKKIGGYNFEDVLNDEF